MGIETKTMNRAPTRRKTRRPARWRWLLAGGAGAALAALLANGAPRWPAAHLPFSGDSIPAAARTRIGINLFGLATYNRQRVFTNLISQSEWLSSRGNGWTAIPVGQLDDKGWVRFLLPGQTAPRPLALPVTTDRTTRIRCLYKGQGTLSPGGAAHLVERGDHSLLIELRLTGAADEGAWIELVDTDSQDPLRDIDCREPWRPSAQRFDPEFVGFLRDFRILRFLDWQRTNDNAPAEWTRRAVPDGSSQVGAGGASVEDMVDLANLVGADPWFLMPYKAQPAYVRAFAQLVHQRLDPGRTVYVELGNEIWNEMFDAARQARREGLALGLGNKDPVRAGGMRYAQKLRRTMRIWTEVYADRPGRLVRVAASHNANPDLSSVVLGYQDTADWVDALATAPYVWVDLKQRSVADLDRIFERSFRALDETIDFAVLNRSIAARYGKRFIAYEGGQHLVTPDMALATRLQRDPRMHELYRRYLERWNARIRSDLTLYASTAPIGEHGSWGLREYAGQPVERAPKLQAVRHFMAAHP